MDSGWWTLWRIRYRFRSNAEWWVKWLNSGTSWTNINDKLPETAINSLTIYGNDIYAGTDYFGVWKRPLNQVITEVRQEAGTGHPEKFYLGQNYPNPFNPSTTIKFSLPEASHVNLSIYNSMGQKVTNLVSQNMDAGVFTAEWNATGYASGIYYYRITAGKYTVTNKMLLLK